jgi:hypothetical protein
MYIAGSVAQVVESLPGKHEALISNANVAKKKKYINYKLK